MYINQHNFNWDLTNKELVLFIPNFKRKQFIEASLHRLKTKVPTDKWMVLIVNDFHHDDMTDLKEKFDFNIEYFTFERESGERNGAMIRNYVIKRIQSRLLVSKDPEIILHSDDCLQKVIQIENEVVRAGRAIELMEYDTPNILKDKNLDVSKLKIRREYPVKQKMCFEGFHYVYCAPVKLLREIGGYEEKFKNYYGAEDWEIQDRLRMHSNIELDKNLEAMHIWHFRNSKFLKGVRNNLAIYDEIKNQKIANKDRDWGNG